MRSRQVSWWTCHEFLTEVVAQANCGPLQLAGSPSWQALANDDMKKLLSLAVAGEHAVLAWEIAQEAAADASRAVAAAEDWPAIARDIRRGRGPAYIPRRKESA